MSFCGGLSVDSSTLRHFVELFVTSPLLPGALVGLRKCFATLLGFVYPKLVLLQQFVLRYKFPLGVVYVGVCLYFGLYLRLGITTLFVMIFYVRTLSVVQEALVSYREGCAIADGHWARDHDLIWL
jgi:hypothetical protein